MFYLIIECLIEFLELIFAMEAMFYERMHKKYIDLSVMLILCVSKE